MDDIVCPRCGYQFDSTKAKIENLNCSARSIWDALGPEWQFGFVPLGPSDIAKKVYLHEATVRHHLSIMVAEGLVKRVPQSASKGRRHLYTGALKHDHVTIT